MDILIEKTLQIPMRDGGKLTADGYRPADNTTVPALVTRLPYNLVSPGMAGRTLPA